MSNELMGVGEASEWGVAGNWCRARSRGRRTGNANDIALFCISENTDVKEQGKSSENTSLFLQLNPGSTLDERVIGKKPVLNEHPLWQVLYETPKLGFLLHHGPAELK